jgi:hypothetical protein
MNKNDSEHMAGLLLGAGAEEVPSAEDSDIILINTCAVRSKSVNKVYSLLGRLKRIKQASQGVQIAVTGCVAQLHRDEIQQRYPYVDLIVGPDNYPALPEMLGKSRLRPQTATAWHSGWQEIRTGYRAKGISGFVTIMEGCNNFSLHGVGKSSGLPHRYSRKPKNWQRRATGRCSFWARTSMSTGTLIRDPASRPCCESWGGSGASPGSGSSPPIPGISLTSWPGP